MTRILAYGLLFFVLIPNATQAREFTCTIPPTWGETTCGEPTYQVPKDGSITFTLDKSDNNVCLNVSVFRKSDGLRLRKSIEVCPGSTKSIPVGNTYAAVEVFLKVECAEKYDGAWGATVTGGVDPGTEANKK